MDRLSLFFVLTLVVLPATPLYSNEANPPFSATCEDVATHGYRYNSDMSGNLMPDSWSTDEKFLNGKWRFLYAGGNKLIINGDEASIVAEHPGVIIASIPATNGFASDVWVYAIHLGLEKVVASQVNGYGHMKDKPKGVKTRSVNLKCTFDIHKGR